MNLSKPAIVTGIILGFFLIVGLWFMGNYNSLVTAHNAVDNSWAKVETQYQKRLDLIDNVLQSVKGAQKQEIAVFGKIADARTQYNNAKTTDEKAEAASNLETNVAIIPKLQEQYPELKSNEQVTALINELRSTETAIAEKRDLYNDTVTNYNNNITRFPKSIFAGMFGYEKAKLFKADAGAATAPKVSF